MWSAKMEPPNPRELPVASLSRCARRSADSSSVALADSGRDCGQRTSGRVGINFSSALSATFVL